MSTNRFLRPTPAAWRRTATAFFFAALALACPSVNAGEPAASPHDDVSKNAARGTSVLTPDGKPAGGAKIALADQGTQINVFNGDAIYESAGVEPREADSAGRFSFPLVTGNSFLVVTHRAGHAEVKCSPESIPETIRLTPWARVEGTYRVARKLQPNVTIEIYPKAIFEVRNVPLPVVFRSVQNTDANGRFVFERVVPGQASIGRTPVFSTKGATKTISGRMVPISLASGQTTPIHLGSSGRPAIGQLKRPENTSEEISWEFGFVAASPADYQARAVGPNFSATFDRNGNFCIDDIPPGKYVLTVFFYKGQQYRLNHTFEVPAINEELSQRPVDLGVLTLNPAEGIR